MEHYEEHEVEHYEEHKELLCYDYWTQLNSLGAEYQLNTAWLSALKLQSFLRNISSSRYNIA